MQGKCGLHALHGSHKCVNCWLNQLKVSLLYIFQNIQQKQAAILKQQPSQCRFKYKILTLLIYTPNPLLPLNLLPILLTTNPPCPLLGVDCCHMSTWKARHSVLVFYSECLRTHALSFTHTYGPSSPHCSHKKYTFTPFL